MVAAAADCFGSSLGFLGFSTFHLLTVLWGFLFAVTLIRWCLSDYHTLLLSRVYSDSPCDSLEPLPVLDGFGRHVRIAQYVGHWELSNLKTFGSIIHVFAGACRGQPLDGIAVAQSRPIVFPSNITMESELCIRSPPCM